MLGLQMLDVGIGLMFVYLVLALACTALMETLAGFVDLRRRNLERGIANLLGDQSLAKKFYAHPLIKALKEDGTPPSYIPCATFATTLVDLLVPTEKAPAPDPANPNPPIPELAAKKPDAAQIREAIKQLKNPDLRTTLLLMLNEVCDEEEKFKAAIETWFNNSMDRISAWYKQKTSRYLGVLAVLVVFSINADTIDLAQQLYKTPSLRQALVAQAQEYAKTNVNPDKSAKPQEPPAANDEKTAAPALPGGDLQSIQKLQDLGLKLGWKNYSSCVSPIKTINYEKWSCLEALLMKFIGLLITVLAISQGAPFWFDTLNRFISIRGVGKSPGELDAKKGKDTKN